MAEHLPEKFFIPVILGQGTVVRTIYGRCKTIGIIAPSDTVVYDMEFIDNDNFGIYGNAGLVGNITIQTEVYMWGTINVVIKNATEDGIFEIKFWYSQNE